MRRGRLPKNAKNEEYLRDFNKAEVARLYLRGETQAKIAERIGVVPMTVSTWLRQMREEWLERGARDFDRAKAEELAKLDELERTAWEAWARSCEDQETTKTIREKSPRRVTVGRKPGTSAPGLVMSKETVEKLSKASSGNPAFLDQVSWCIAQRCKILGLTDEKNAQAQQVVIQFPWEQLYGRPPAADPVGDEVERRALEAAKGGKRAE